MKRIQIVTVGLQILIVRRERLKLDLNWSKSRLDIPIDQELPDDEDGRRNKDIVRTKFE